MVKQAAKVNLIFVNFRSYMDFRSNFIKFFLSEMKGP